MKPFDVESIVLGTILKYGMPAMSVVPTELAPDKFIFNFDGQFGTDHSRVFKGIQDTVRQHRTPTLVEVVKTLGGVYFTPAQALVDRLERQYKIYVFDDNSFRNFVMLVDTQGVVYNLGQQATILAQVVADTDALQDVVHKIKNIDEWSSQQLGRLSAVVSATSSGYKSAATISKDVEQSWDDQFAGKISAIVDCGLPVLKRNKIPPRGKLTVVHGLSGSGKSSLVFEMCLGAAIQLYLSGDKGCIAINSLEMEQEDLVEKFASILSGVDVTKLQDNTLTQPELDALHKWAAFVKALPIFIDDTNFMTTTAMEYRSRGLHVSEHGPVVMLATDYGELFKDDGDSEEQRVNTIFREQFRLSREINAAVIAISQSTVDKAVSGKTYIAGADGTRYSRGVLQATDVLIELWNPEQIEAANRQIQVPESLSTAHPWLFIQKYRKGAIGKPIPLGWKASTTAFFDLDVNFGATIGKEIIFTNLDAAYAKYLATGATW